ncbi:MAG TPA: asparagine synthase (glutamine-hydrolyzing) [Allosphingosinicella sp.]|nr:asparagine synthase (glutamine-hydrolyzing) [Allosphingosinicella sp.]
MGGIAGIFHPDVPKPVDPARVEAMAGRLAHRGPNGSGVWTAPGIGMGHREFLIVEGTDASQPMVSEDRRAALSFDGEIYNFRELRTELEAKGHAFRTEGDIEVVLASWRQWGPDCLARFDGVFAFALYDAAGDTLFLARDRLGVKPLFHAILSDGALIFASELKGLLSHPRLRRSVRPQAVEDYLALGYVPDDTCFIDGVSKLSAGHFLLVRRGRSVPKPTAYWDLDFSRPEKRPLRQLQDEMLERLGVAVRSRMVSQVPTGVFLGGGIGSSAIVAFIAEVSRGAVETWSIGLDETEADETRLAAMVAEHFVTRHRTCTAVVPEASRIGALADVFDEPFADAAALMAYQLSALAVQEARIIMTGDGTDELFAGHRRYQLFRREERVRHFLPLPARRVLGSAGELLPEFNGRRWALRVKGALQAVGMSPGEAYASAVAVTPRSLRSTICSGSFQKLVHGHRFEDRYVRAFEQAPASDSLSRAQYADLKISLPGDTLTRLDRTSMAVSLQARTPLLDHRLVEFAARLPAGLRLRGANGQWLLKRGLNGRLPNEVLSCRRTRFAAPVGHWFRGPLAGDAAAMAHGSTLAELGWFDPNAIARLAEDHRQGRSDHGQLLWQLLMLENSLRRLAGTGALTPVDRQPRQNRARQAAR